uniref:Uncharacterized protein n=1 Tax=Knipowitschia caucasica TaxID=637954 RepID=A0AAV2KGT3_KNICA
MPLSAVSTVQPGPQRDLQGPRKERVSPESSGDTRPGAARVLVSPVRNTGLPANTASISPLLHYCEAANNSSAGYGLHHDSFQTTSTPPPAPERCFPGFCASEAASVGLWGR